jgi:DNA-binding CsgD family transcriptional regulator
MEDAANILNIDLLATRRSVFTAHFENSFCHLDTLKPTMPEISWVNRSDANFYGFKYGDRLSGMSQEEIDCDSGINFQRYDHTYDHNLYTLWAVTGYSWMYDNLVRGLACTITVTNYRTDRLRVVVEKKEPLGPYWFPVEVDPSWVPPASEPVFGLFTRVFIGWLEARWGKEEYGYIRLSPEDAPRFAHEPLLTQAEKEIAEMLAKGMDDEAISKARVSSRKTVETQRKGIAKKLGIKADKGTIAEFLKPFGFASV